MIRGDLITSIFPLSILLGKLLKSNKMRTLILSFVIRQEKSVFISNLSKKRAEQGGDVLLLI
jgi:hypothetical protein